MLIKYLISIPYIQYHKLYNDTIYISTTIHNTIHLQYILQYNTMQYNTVCNIILPLIRNAIGKTIHQFYNTIQYSAMSLLTHNALNKHTIILHVSICIPLYPICMKYIFWGKYSKYFITFICLYSQHGVNAHT